MLRHQNKIVQAIEPSFPAIQQCLNHDLSYCVLLEKCPPLPGFRGDEVSTGSFDAMLGSDHCLQGLKPLRVLFLTYGLKPVPANLLL